MELDGRGSSAWAILPSGRITINPVETRGRAPAEVLLGIGRFLGILTKLLLPPPAPVLAAGLLQLTLLLAELASCRVHGLLLDGNTHAAARSHRSPTRTSRARFAPTCPPIQPIRSRA